MRGTESFDDLQQRRGPFVLAHLKRLLWDIGDAEDVAQDVWLKVHGALPRFRGGAAVDSWIYRITVNAARSHRRRVMAKRRCRALDVDLARAAEAVAPDLDPHARLEQVEQRAWLRRNLRQLRPPVREALIALYLEELTREETAARMCTTEDSVKMRAHRGVLALRRLARRSRGIAAS